MNAARQGIITDEMRTVAEKEGIAPEKLMEYVAAGTAIIPCNKNHKAISPAGVGSMLKTKINVNLGTSRDCKDLNMELEKVQSAVDMGAEAIMDLSSCGDTQKFRRLLTEKCPAMIGTVPIYDAVVYYPVGGDAVTLTTEAASAIAAQYQAIGTLVPVTALNQANVSAMK